MVFVSVTASELEDWPMATLDLRNSGACNPSWVCYCKRLLHSGEGSFEEEGTLS